MDLSTTFCGIKFSNPTVLASGVLGVTGDSMRYVIEAGAGAVTTKSTDMKGRTGHPNPIIITHEGGMMNAVGLSNPGIKEEIETIADFKKQCKNPLFLSIFDTLSEFEPKPIGVVKLPVEDLSKGAKYLLVGSLSSNTSLRIS